MKDAFLKFTRKGIFCEKGDFYIDPWEPVNKAIITHAHSDHAKLGHQHYLSHHHSIPILKQRLGSIRVEGKEYEETFYLNGVKVSLHPAGHIIGSSQIRVEYNGEVWCVSGDYKTDPDPIAEDFYPVKCNTFITECTFGLPIYKWPKENETVRQIESWWIENQKQGKTSLLCAYALGKAQRILSVLNHSIGEIYCHGAIDTVNRIHNEMGILKRSFPYLTNDVPKEKLRKALVIAPPSAIGSPWASKLKPYSVGTASGWMMLRGSKRRQNVDRGFILSDHADWIGLNLAIKATQTERVICTHGYTDTFSQWLEYNGYEAFSEETFFEGESLDPKSGDL
ncbi:MAG: ligase-associated DNA damage response exonuclease [Bacteroidota bacterium]